MTAVDPQLAITEILRIWSISYGRIVKEAGRQMVQQLGRPRLDIVNDYKTGHTIRFQTLSELVLEIFQCYHMTEEISPAN